MEIRDLETDKVVLYPSIYKAALALDQNPGEIGMYNGKVWRNRYAIRVLTESFKSIDLSLALHKHFLDSHDRRGVDF